MHTEIFRLKDHSLPPDRKIDRLIIEGIPEDLKGKIFDGYHTFDELYNHRVTLWIALCRTLEETLDLVEGALIRMGDPVQEVLVDFQKQRQENFAWRSKAHHPDDTPMYDGWFILGLTTSDGQLSYHLPLSRWDETDFAETLDSAPKWDGHTSDDVIERLKKL